MKVYVLTLRDRHTDPQPFVRTDPQRAVDEARALLAERLHEDDADDDELGEQQVDGYLFTGRWSHEGDKVDVVECELDGPLVLH